MTLSQDVSTPTVMDILRESTHDLHNDAEGQDFQKSLGGGTVQLPAYRNYLAQLFLMHSHLNKLLQGSTSNPSVGLVLKPYHLDCGCLERDLAHFQEDLANIKPLASTSKIMADLTALSLASPYALLGALYVLEGSTNGAKFMAKNLRKGLDLPEESGASYFDRYGALQRQYWLKFKEDMVACNFSEDECQTLVQSARRMFQAFFEIGRELQES